MIRIKKIRRTREQVLADDIANRALRKATERKKFIKKLPYKIEVPNGFKSLAQNYCRVNLGKPYLSYNPWSDTEDINKDGLWVYHTENNVGTMYFKEEEHTKLVGQVITMTLLKR
jgi:hypothetical protein